MLIFKGAEGTGIILYDFRLLCLLGWLHLVQNMYIMLSYVALLSDRQKGLANAKGLIQRKTGCDINGN